MEGNFMKKLHICLKPNIGNAFIAVYFSNSREKQNFYGPQYCN